MAYSPAVLLLDGPQRVSYTSDGHTALELSARIYDIAGSPVTTGVPHAGMTLETDLSFIVQPSESVTLLPGVKSCLLLMLKCSLGDSPWSLLHVDCLIY